MPVKRDIKAAITIKPQTIKVGKFGTRPVLVYVIKIGTKNAAEIKVNSRAIMLKKLIGL